MPRAARIARGGMVFHVLNRGNDRREILDDRGDYEAFLRVVRVGEPLLVKPKYLEHPDRGLLLAQYGADRAYFGS